MKSLKSAWKNLETTLKIFIACFLFYFISKTLGH